MEGRAAMAFEPDRSIGALYGRIFGHLAAHAALDHLNFKEDEASHKREGSSSLKFR
jgi:hypothetical protein